jgi:hypothetical protein
MNTKSMLKVFVLLLAASTAVTVFDPGAMPWPLVAFVQMAFVTFLFVLAVAAVDAKASKTKPVDRLVVVPGEFHKALEAASLRYAEIWSDEFQGDGMLRVSSTRLRDVGLIDSSLWAKVPAHDIVRVHRNQDGSLEAGVMLPWQ